MLIDTHCHLNLRESFPDPEKTIAEAQDSGVLALIVVGMDFASNSYAIELAERFTTVFAVVGWHPNSASTWSLEAEAQVRDLLQHPKCVAIGEIGLDYHWDYATQNQQITCLNRQLELADEWGKPIVIHCRDAWEDLLGRLEQDQPRTYHFHCFSGNRTQSERCLKIGGYLGFDGPLTYKKNADLRALASEMPADRILLETDSPYLAPEPLRGKPNSPKNLALVNQLLASLRGMSPVESAEQTSANARRFFRLD